MAKIPANMKLNLPMNEASGIKTAFDYSYNRYDATLQGTADFGEGREGNAVHFPDGNGSADIASNILDLSGDFTIMAYIKDQRAEKSYTPGNFGLFINLPTLSEYQETWVKATPGKWNHIVIVKEGLGISLYINSTRVKYFELPAQPTGIAIVQDYYNNSGLGYGAVDEVQIYDTAMTSQDIQKMEAATARINYLIDGKNIQDWDIYVSDSAGLLDRPRMKTPHTVKWDDYHGEVVDLKDKRLEPREITLLCFMKAAGKLDFATKLNEFMQLFQKDGTNRLSVDLHPTKPLLYEVYCLEGIPVNKRWNNDIMVGTFSLNLREPEPVKRVIRHARSSTATSQVSITLSSLRSLSISWGDGTYTNNVYGENKTLTHSYSENGIYFIVISGNIEDITAFSTNGIIIWNKL